MLPGLVDIIIDYTCWNRHMVNSFEHNGPARELFIGPAYMSRGHALLMLGVENSYLIPTGQASGTWGMIRELDRTENPAYATFCEYLVGRRTSPIDNASL
jgi:hypothetical protein